MKSGVTCLYVKSRYRRERAMDNFINIGTLLSAQNHFIIPDYQREYSWGKTENQTLWNDIVELVGQKKQKHFLGALVTSDYQPQDSVLAPIKPAEFNLNPDEVSQLLDGQQRLTSISLLVAAIRTTLSEDSSLDTINKKLIDNELFKLLFNDEDADEGLGATPRLFLKENSGKYYYQTVLELNLCDSPNPKSKAVKNMRLAFSTYKDCVREWVRHTEPDNRLNRYKALCNTIQNRVQVVDIHCKESMNEFQVFESLNGKGLNLTAVDRIRSIFLSKAAENNADGASSWQELYALVGGKDDQLLHFFITLFFDREGKRFNKVQLPSKFKELANEGYQSFGGLKADLYSAIRTYGTLRDPSSNSSGLPKTDHLLQMIGGLGQEQIYVPLYSAAKRYHIDSSEFYKVARILLNYTVRFSVCGKPTNTLDTEFSKMISIIREKSCQNVCDYIISRMEDDEIFRNDFSEFSTTNTGFAHYLLEELERFCRIKSGDGNQVPRNLTLEHIIPRRINYVDWYGKDNVPDSVVLDSYREDYINSIGNMALIFKSDNSAASNKNYAEKKHIYEYGSTHVHDYGRPADTFYLIKELLTDYPTEFTHTQVLERARLFSVWAPVIWKKEQSCAT